MFIFLNLIAPLLVGLNKLVYRLILCSSPRKSLVKGERFMRGLKRNQSYRSKGLQSLKGDEGLLENGVS